MATQNEAAECVYCGHDGVTLEVPAAGDDAAWAELAGEHAEGCEWVLTRAHRREAAAAE